MAIQETEKIWMNGKLTDWKEAEVHVLTHALHYGTGVFEGIRCYNTEKGPAVFRLKEHMKRLANSAKIYMMPIPYSVDELCAAAKDVVKSNKLTECYIRPIVFRGYGEMGLNPAKAPVDAAIAAWKWGAYLGEEGLKNGIKAKISSFQRIAPNILPPEAKATGQYINSILAKFEAVDAGYDEAIVLDNRGFISEGPGENLFMVKDGILYTPPLYASNLPGITRDSAMTIAKDLGYTVKETDMTRGMLYTADEAFFSGTAAEITPIRNVDGREIGKPGPVTKAIQDKFFAAVKGQDRKYEKWLDYVNL